MEVGVGDDTLPREVRGIMGPREMIRTIFSKYNT